MSDKPVTMKPPGLWLSEAEDLKGLYEKAGRIVRLQQLLEAQLQPAVRPFCKVASWKDYTLLLVVTDANWATKLRYQQRRIMRQLAAHGEFAGIQRIIFKVEPPIVVTKPQSRKIKISEASSEQILCAANGISDPKLKSALERLASRGKADD